MAGFEAAGLYQSAWSLGGLYVGVILQAMGADFYPRLTAFAKNNLACNRMVNEQTYTSLLLAGPGVLATLAFAPMVVSVFYSGRFDGAVDVLRWFCLGMTLRVITWPLGYIILAKGESTFFIVTEVAWTVVNVGLSWVCIRAFGLNGAGVAFFGSYVFHGLLVYPMVRHLSGFRWTISNVQTGLLLLSGIMVVFCGFYLLSSWAAMTVGILATLFCSAYSIRVLLDLVSTDRIPHSVERLLVRFGLTRTNSDK